MELTTFASGSGGNCALLHMDGVYLLLDAGISARRIRENLALSGLRVEDLSAILLTHEHNDHISGLPNLLKRSAVPVYAPCAVANYLRYTIAGVEQYLREVPVGEPQLLAGLRLTAFPTPHDTPGSVGWRVEGSESFALATDLGHVTEEIRGALYGAALVMLEANHDVTLLQAGAYPLQLKKRILSDHGHLSNESSAALAAELAAHGTKQIVLVHLSRENNTPAKALQTVRAAVGDLPAAVYIAPAAERLTVAVEREMSCLP